MTSASTTDSRLTPSQAARRLGLSSQSIGDLFDAGRLTGQRTPLGRLIDTASVERLAAERAAAKSRRTPGGEG